MAARPTFSQHLMGLASPHRPAFFFAYAGMWIHQFIGAGLLVFFDHVPMLEAFAALTIASFSIALLVYAVLSRQYSLLVNAVSYGLSMTSALSPGSLHFVFPFLAVTIALVSGYAMMSREYCRYAEEVGGGRQEGMPVWIGVLVAVVIISLCLLGLSML